MGDLRLVIVGCGDAFGSGARHHACFLLEHGQHRVLLDCGASAPLGLRARDIGPETIDAVVLSHLHGDHFGGVPFLVLDGLYMTPRVKPLVVAGPPGVETRVMGILDLLYPGARGRLDERPFLRFVELHPRTGVEVAGMRAIAFPVTHPSGAPSYALRVEAAGRAVAYSGDTEWVEALVEASRDAHVFLCECWTFDRRLPYHINYRRLVDELPRLSAARVVLTHLGPEMLAHAADVQLEMASEGLVITL